MSSTKVGLGGRKGGTIETYTGNTFFPLDPRIDEIRIEDIAHALSLLCRFGGHCNDFYSVAQHSFFVSKLVPAEHALQALLHDASEAYLVDVPRPIKHDDGMSFYRFAERQLQRVIYMKFNLPIDDHESIKLADDRMLAAEHIQLFKTEPANVWSCDGKEAINFMIAPLTPKEAENQFLNSFYGYVSKYYHSQIRDLEANDCA